MLNLSYKNIKLIPKKSVLKSRKDADITAKLGKHTFAAPVVAANMKSILTPEICKIFDERNWFYIQERVSGIEFVRKFIVSAQESFNVISISIGISDDWLSLLAWAKRYKYRIDYITFDIAHAHTDFIIEPVRIAKEIYPEAFIIVGNVSTPEAVEFLETMPEIDCIKVGQGVSCFAAGTRVLMANGSYKNIENLNVGDMVISGTGKPTKVLGVRQSGYSTVMSYYHPRFYEPTVVTNDHLHFVSDISHLATSTIHSLNKALYAVNNPQSYRWKTACSLSKLDSFLLPAHIDFSEMERDFSICLNDFCDSNRTVQYNTEEIKPSYELGYLIGSFLGDGSAGSYTRDRVSPRDKIKITKNTNHSCSFTFDKDELDVASKIKDYGHTVFGVKAKIVYPNSKGNKKNTHNVYFYCNPVSKFFQQFYNSDREKFIPQRYFVNNKDYLNGILDGFFESDGSSKGAGRVYSNTSKVLLEQCAIICYLVKGFFPSISQKKKYSEGLLTDGRLIKPSKDSFNLYYSDTYETIRRNDDYFVFQPLGFNHSYSSNLEVPVYDIEVECETSSFIANNVIVHNSACRTYQYTGFGSASLGSLMACASANQRCLLMSDGGLTVEGTDVWIGDIAKAIRFGADFVMSGSLISKCTDCPATLYGYAGNASAEVRGHRHNVEGASVKIETNGLKITEMMSLVEDSLKSSISYSGGTSLEALAYVNYVNYV